MIHKNFKNIDNIVFGRGAFNQLGDIIKPVRNKNEKYFAFIVDEYFKDSSFASQLPVEQKDEVIFINVDVKEPTTQQVDLLRDTFLGDKGLPAGVVGMGGGSIMDIAKALSLMFTNEGSSEKYQGLNLVKQAGIYHLGIPTISGTGAECSMTAVLSGPEKKLGLKCDWTVFNQVILDPNLISSVPKQQWFYTGMDTYIHCVESRCGINNNSYSTAYGDQAIQLCEEVFLGNHAGQSSENDEKLMIASLFGGLSLTYSEVGICHSLSYGLSVVLGTRHCEGNCLIFNHLEQYYGDYVKDFHKMLDKHEITLPKHISKDWTDEQVSQMAQVSLNLPFMWRHALGENWQDKVSTNDVKKLFLAL